jgi:hypothetical protein
MQDLFKETTTAFVTDVNKAAFEFTKTIVEAQSTVAKRVAGEFTKHYDQDKVNAFYKPWQDLAMQSARAVFSK